MKSQRADKTTKSTPAGRAYGFFKCNASEEEVRSELPHIHRAIKAPSELELSLTGVDDLQGDDALMDITREAKEAGINYVLQTTYNNATNEQAAEKTVHALMKTYQSPLYSAGEPLHSDVVYEDNGRYIFKE